MSPIRTASNTCIYWQTVEDKPDLEKVGLSGQCSANNYFSITDISCYNDGKCDGAGTCIGCSAYDVGGLKYSHKDTTQLYTTKSLYVWNSEQNKYVEVSNLNPSERSDLTTFLETYNRESCEGSRNVHGVQTPINLLIYNLRAKFKKCCNWEGPPVIFSKDKTGKLKATYYSGLELTSVEYLPKDNTELDEILQNPPDVSASLEDKTKYKKEVSRAKYTSAINPQYNRTNSNKIGEKCKLGSITNKWKLPLSEGNDTVYGCNGCKPECPYYTGPKWTYCVDSKMEDGDTISASQIMELRYYSTDWSSFDNPQYEWDKRFKNPVIWAWTGELENVTESDESSLQDNTMVRDVSINGFSTSYPDIVIGAPVPAAQGLVVKTETGKMISANYPTLIEELNDVPSNISVTWPKSTSYDPYVFKTFRIGQNIIRVFIETPYTSTVYAVNLTTRSQEDYDDSEYISYMQTTHPEELFSVENGAVDTGLVYFDLELEYNPEINVFKFFTRDPTSSSGEYLTTKCYVRHKFYHAMAAQTEGVDYVGHSTIQTWIDYFEKVYFAGNIFDLTGGVSVDSVLWDTYAGAKLTVYPIEEIVSEERQDNWQALHCHFAAITFSDVRCNSVMPWRLSGECRGTSLKVYVNRTANPAATEEGDVDLQVYFRSNNGQYIPGNVIIVGPVSGQYLSSALDPTKDVIYATYAVTEYYQGPVSAEHRSKLKYPAHYDFYLDTMPLDISYTSTSFTVDGNFISVNTPEGDSEEKIYSLDSFKETLYRNLSTAESDSVDSFQSGGLCEDSIDTSSDIFQSALSDFINDYGSKVFESDGENVTVLDLCDRLKDLKVNEGDYKLTFIFKDEEGRPIGVKRNYMLIQSAVAECRDVEIRYKWEMTARDWLITDQYLLLARHNEPTKPSDPYGSVFYNPKCGDHSEILMGSHNFGEPGPMWYPYDRCYEPRYDVDEITDYVKCNNPVEGFTEESEGKRWAYWERMRGPDKYRTWIGGPIFLVGCFYRDVSYTYETVDEQNFAGYTRIRSCHPYGPFSKDREALHINRHYLKRNLKVREEVITSDSDLSSVGWSDDYYQYLYAEGEDGSAEIRVGSELDTAIWVHLNDGVSIVNRTTSEAQHPFSHYLLSTVGNYDFNEVYNYSPNNRYSLNEVIKDRDLTSTDKRDPESKSLVYSPEDPDYFSNKQSYSDIIPVFSLQNTAWAWLERPKDPARSAGYSGFYIDGISLYNPTQSVWKKDRTSATYSDEGAHSLTYTAPVFDDTGNIQKHPTFSWFGGPPRELNWYTGEWIDEGTVYDSSSHYSKPNFSFFGKGTDGSSFLIDGSGYHTYIMSVDNDGVTYGTTFRGLGVNSSVSASDLPYSLVDLVDEDEDVHRAVYKSNSQFKPGSGGNITINLKGYYYVDRIELFYSWGDSVITESEYIKYDIPETTVFAGVLITDDGSTQASKAYQVSVGEYQQSQGDSNPLDGEVGAVYGGYDTRKVTYSVAMRCDHLLISFESIPSNGWRKIDEAKIWYRKPEDRGESVTVYERKVNISTGNTGYPDYRKLLYYYNRTIASAADTYGYNLLFLEGLQSIKLTSKSVKDVILEYEFFDPSGTRFPYMDGIRPEDVGLFTEDTDGLLTYQDSVDICTKSRTLIAGTHVNDNPQNVTGHDFNPNQKATNETSTCGDSVGNRRLDETVQECLYNQAKDLVGGSGDIVTTFEWFWHPDELSFWVDTVGVDLTNISPTLTLRSKVSSLYKLFQHEDFGCSSEKTVPFYDGRIHYIPKWQAIGHWLYAGLPAYNHACADVVIFKIGKHLEASFGSYDYGSNKDGRPNWPYDTYKDAAFYLEAGRVEKRGTYIGGRMGGVGPAFWAAQSDLAHGFTLPQQIDQQETYENVEGGRIQSTRAEASRTGYHTDEPAVYSENSDSPI